MKGKAALLVGLATGYVLGTRDGRERYLQIKTQANRIVQDPRVQQKATQAADLAKAKVPVLKDKLPGAGGGGTGNSGAAGSATGAPSSMTSTPPTTTTTADEAIIVTTAPPGPLDDVLDSPSPADPATGGLGGTTGSTHG
jgi:hypothetical protein